MASGTARGRVRTTKATTQSRNIAAITETRLNLFSWVFCGSAPSIAELMKFFKERKREESRARINRDRSSQEDRERERARLKERRRKWY